MRFFRWLRRRGPSAPPRVGVALGGGLPFGVVAAGALDVLDSAGIPIHYLAGTSMGAIVAALYAAGSSAAEIERAFVDHFRRSQLLPLILHDFRLSPYGFFNGEHLMRLLADLLGEDRRFEELRIPLAIPAVDLLTAEEVIFDSGPVLPAIRASISLPAVFKPFHHRGRYLVDGAMLSPVPIDLLERMGATRTIAIRGMRSPAEPVRTSVEEQPDSRSASSAGVTHATDAAGCPADDATISVTDREDRHPPNMVHTLWRAMATIEQDRFAALLAERADLRLLPRLPPDLARDTHRLPELIEIGRQEARRHLPEIKRQLNLC